MSGGRDRFIPIDGQRLRVQISGQGPPLLLINGIGASVEMWRPLIDAMPQRQLVAFDLPGCGRSPAPTLPPRMRGLAALVAKLLISLRQKGLVEAPRGGIDVLGYSFGGAVAQELAHRFPKSVRSLILCATTPGIPSLPPNPIVAAMMLSPARYYNETLGALMIPHIVGGRTAKDREVLHRGLHQRLQRPPSIIGYAYQLYAITGWSSQPWLHRLSQPALVLHGDDDPVAPLFNARRMAQMIPHGRLHVLEGAGHLFLVDQPEAAIPPIRSFLQRRSGRLARSAGARQ